MEGVFAEELNPAVVFWLAGRVRRRCILDFIVAVVNLRTSELEKMGVVGGAVVFDDLGTWCTLLEHPAQRVCVLIMKLTMMIMIKITTRIMIIIMTMLLVMVMVMIIFDCMIMMMMIIMMMKFLKKNFCMIMMIIMMMMTMMIIMMHSS